jgi:hypothetical protein
MTMLHACRKIIFVVVKKCGDGKATILASIQIGVGNMPCPEIHSSFGLKKQQSQPISMVLQECNAHHRPP